MVCKNCTKEVDKKCTDKTKCINFKLKPVTPDELPKQQQ